MEYGRYKARGTVLYKFTYMGKRRRFLDTFIFFQRELALHVFLHTDIENGIPGNCNFLKLLEFYNKWTNSQRNLHDVSDVYCNNQGCGAGAGLF